MTNSDQDTQASADQQTQATNSVGTDLVLAQQTLKTLKDSLGDFSLEHGQQPPVEQHPGEGSQKN